MNLPAPAAGTLTAVRGKTLAYVCEETDRNALDTLKTP